MNDQGIIITATQEKKFYDCAIANVNSILEYMPSAKVTLFTSKELFNPIHSSFFDNVVLDTPDEVRAKIWAMTNSPYELTLYLDADMLVCHSDFNSVFDQIDQEDMLWTKITKEREYAYNTKDGSNITFPGGQIEIFGGVCLYKSSAQSFMSDWYELDKKMREKKWWPSDVEKYPTKFAKWDQFSLWWLTNQEWDNYQYLSYDFFKDDFRWNWLYSYSSQKEGEDLPGKQKIIMHHKFRR